MKFIIQIGLALTFLFGSMQINAEVSINKFMNASQASASFNCAYKGKAASKKCVDTRSMVKASIDSVTKQIYGANESLPLLTIRWPDGDVSRYLGMDSWEPKNLGDQKTYRLKTLNTDESQLDLRRGVIIQSDVSTEHVRFW